eukprot:10976442-Heterocapsa_arctica.AAC.1
MVAPLSASVARVQVPRPEKEMWCVHPVWWEMVGASINMPSGLSLKITKSAVSSWVALPVGSWKW